MDLIAKRSFRYGTRALTAGELFTASRRDARILKALKKAVDAPAAPEPARDEGPDLGALRERYSEIYGKRPYYGWDAETLVAKIAEAQG